MKKMILGFSILALTSCGVIKVQLVPSDDLPTKTAQLVENQGQALEGIIALLKEKGLLESPKK